MSLFCWLEANYFTILWWFLPYIHINQPWVYMCSPSWSSLPPSSPSHPSGSSQCTSPEHTVLCIETGLVIYFIYDQLLQMSTQTSLPLESLSWLPLACSLCNGINYSSVQSLSRVRLFATPWTVARQASLSIINSQSLLRLMSIKSVMPSNPSPPLSPTSPSTFNLSQHQGLFKWVRIWWPKYWSLSFSISPSNEYSGLISFRLGWLDLLAVQGTLKSLLQYHSSKASILQHSAFFVIQLTLINVFTHCFCSLFP